MTETPRFLPGTPPAALQPEGVGLADLLSDILRTVHLSGMVLFRAEFREPWSVATPASCQLAQSLPFPTEHIIQFHIVAAGECWLEVEGHERIWLNAGDAVVLPYGNNHTLGGRRTSPSVPIASLFPPQPWRDMPVIQHGESGAGAQLICGFLHCDELLFSPLKHSLPVIMHARPRDELNDAWLAMSIRYITQEALQPRPGSRNILARLTELMFIEVLRRHIQALPDNEVGWLAALNDPIVGNALKWLHSMPDEKWTVTLLAQRVGTSRSVLAERFKYLLDQPPMQYLAHWRLLIASQILKTSDANLKSVVARVGYESEPAFNRAFKRLFGMPPASWRKQQIANTSHETTEA
ncbi:MAG: helix-turn-helix domain-containing protein [Gammaproteobacteria bacterium]|nr:helix-turn-helix domain-containing protein [Gammaproteobacteria bacterium]